MLTRFLVPVGIGTICLAGVAHSAPDAAKRQPPALFKSLSACRAITPDDARLKCFEDATAKMEAAFAREDLYITDKAQVREARRTLFGLPVPNIGKLFGGDGKDEDKEEFSAITSTVSGVSEASYGNVRLTLADGAIWETTEPMKFPPRKGQQVQIKRGLAGGFRLTIDGTLARVKRVQ